jgi:hypothetical protein
MKDKTEEFEDLRSLAIEHVWVPAMECNDQSGRICRFCRWEGVSTN